MTRWKQRLSRYGLLGVEEDGHALDLVLEGLRAEGSDEDFIEVFQDGWDHAMWRLSESDDPDETFNAFQSEANDLYPGDDAAAEQIYEGMLAAFWFRELTGETARVEVRRVSDGKVFSSVCKADLVEDDLRQLLLQAGLEESMVAEAMLAGGVVDFEWSVRTGGSF
jgi:hypothetical protein